MSAVSFWFGAMKKNVGERCSIVTCAASDAMLGISVAAVAPDPITTTRLPVRSRPSGQRWGCTTVPSKRSKPGHCGV